MDKKKPRKKPKKRGVFFKKLPQGARDFVSEHDLIVRHNVIGNAGKPKYTMKKYLLYYDGYDFLQNLGLVRKYICKKYDITYNLFEILLYLFPLNFFTKSDFSAFPHQFTFCKIESLIELGFVSLAVKGKTKDQNLYTLNKKGKSLVMTTYKCLSGEVKIQESPQYNPLASPKATAFDKKHMDLIKHLNQQEVPPTKKLFFE